MISVRTFALLVITFFSSAHALLAQTVLVRDTFSYPTLASFEAQWPQIIGYGLSFTPGTDSVSLGNTLAIRDFGPNQFIRPQQNWNLTCGISQTSYQRGQWFGLFSEDMCHGYLVRWDSATASQFGGNGSYSLYQYNSTTPVSAWNPTLGSPFATCAGNQPALVNTPVNFKLCATWDTTTGMRQVTLTVPNAAGATTILQAEVPDTDQRVYTRVALSGNTSGIFSNLTLTTQDKIFNVTSFGATGNGSTDDTAAINQAISAAQAVGGSVYIPGTAHSYLYSSCLSISGITLYGDGNLSLLQASNPFNSAIIIGGDHTVLDNVKITSPLSSTIGRQSTPQTAGVMINGASNFTVENVSINTTASVGIISLGGYGTSTSPALISHCSVANTLADGIHLTDQSCYIKELNNTVSNSGDDMFAVVSYTRDGGMCHDITITGNSGAGQSAPGRGISVVGGYNVTILNNSIQNSTAAGIYLQSELVRNPNGSLLYKTYGDNNITVEDNVLNGLASMIYHGGINLGGPADTTDAGQTESAPMLITNVTISGNTIANCTHSGVCLQGYFNDIYLEGNAIDTTAEQGLVVYGGSNLFVGDSVGNTFEGIGSYGIYTGYNSSIPTLTTGTILIENNVFGDTNVHGTFALPIISIGSSTVSGSVSSNQFNVSGKYLISMPYVRYGVE